jgi:hypothetical protein
MPEYNITLLQDLNIFKKTKKRQCGAKNRDKSNKNGNICHKGSRMDVILGWYAF